ncbi:MAG: hypothetical protein Q9195_001502 [Heterodermia aff. obscurata]
MATRKRNEYLDIASSDDESASGYDSEAAQATKGSRATAAPKRSPKRRRLDANSSSSSSSDSDSDNIPPPTHDPAPTHDPPAKIPSPDPKQVPQPKPPPLTPKSLLATNTLAQNRGVVYLSRIPPFMRPSTVRHLLSPHGTITRLFLTPEPHTSYTSRKKSGGNKKRSFIDGWLEFSRKKDAKICVEAINGQIVGGKKGGWYRDDVWNAKYLRGFGWEDLMESVRREEREREEKIRVGVRREGKERREFLKGVERGKVEEGKRRKREAREARKGERGEEGQVEVKAPVRHGIERIFKQNEVSGRKEKGAAQSDEVKRVLSKIF